MEEINSNYTKIPNDLLFSGNPHEVVLWGIIRHFETMEQGICNCSINTLAKYLQLSRVQTQRILSDMVTKKIISVTQKKGFNSQYRTICNFSSTIAENSNTEKNVRGEKNVTNDKISRCIKNDTTVKNVTGDISSMIQGDVSSMIQGDVSSMIHHNKTVYNKTEDNNSMIDMSCHVSARTHEDQIPNFFDFEVVNPEFDKEKPYQINFDILPWLPGVPDKVYHIAKSIDYRMTVSEMYKFSLMLAIGGYYNGYTFCPVNNLSLMLLKWKQKQDETNRLSSMIDDLDNINTHKPNQGRVLKTVTIPYGGYGDIIIERLQPITQDPEIFINRENCRFESSTSYSKQEKRKFADGKHLPGINDYGESDDF